MNLAGSTFFADICSCDMYLFDIVSNIGNPFGSSEGEKPLFPKKKGPTKTDSIDGSRESKNRP